MKDDVLVVIVGETASGKSALAMDVAREVGGEIICADSRTVYKGMDIGTAKPSAADRKEVQHHLLDVVNPGERFTVADFKLLAEQAIEDIVSRGKVPIMVGGTGLYVDSVLFDYQFSEAGVERDEHNPRHLKKTEHPIAHQLRVHTLVVGLTLEREVLEQRVQSRVEQMLEAGFVDEVRGLIATYGANVEALRAPGYKAFMAYLLGELNLDQAKQQFTRSDLQLAKRQRAWFKRNKSIQWAANTMQAKSLVQNFLSNSDG